MSTLNGKTTVRNHLKTLKFGDIEKQLNTATKNTYVSESARVMKDAAELGALLQKTRTFNGATVPGTGAVSATVLPTDAIATLQPSTGESWRVLCMKMTNNDGAAASVLTIGVTDGSTSMAFHAGSVAAGASIQFGMQSGAETTGALNLPLTNALYLYFSQDGNAAAVTVEVPYTQDVI